MKLYFSPGACSLSDHIALLEAGHSPERVRVDLKTKTTRSGEDFTVVNPKGYVPTLVTDEGETLTENVAILDWIAERTPALMPAGSLGRTRQIEALAYMASEVHKSFAPLMHGGSDDEQDEARAKIAKRLRYLADTMTGPYLFGEALSAADCYLFVMLRWAAKFDLDVPADLVALRDRVAERPATRTALAYEDEG